MNMKNFLREKMRSHGADAYKKLLCNEVLHSWNKIVDEDIAAQVRPVAIEHGTLFVDAKSSAFKDQLKFFAEEIIDAVNENFAEGEPLVKEIRIAQGFQVAKLPPEENPAPEVKPKVTLEETVLTAEEIAQCEEQVKKFSDEKLRETVLKTLLARAKAQKFRVANGWHKCRKCDTLCEAEEIFCEACRIRERGAMVEELFKIFYDEPWLKTEAAQKILLERMPHMKRECSPPAVESARTSLIQKVAGRVRLGDENSPEVLKLVMLEKRLPPDKLTPAIIQRTLIDLQFNLSDGAQVRRYNAHKSPRK